MVTLNTTVELHFTFTSLMMLWTYLAAFVFIWGKPAFATLHIHSLESNATLIHIYSCHKRIFLIEQIDTASDLVAYLSSYFDYADFVSGKRRDIPVDLQNECLLNTVVKVETEAVDHRKNIFTAEYLHSLLMDLNVDLLISVFVYISSWDNNSLYTLKSATYKELAGCLISRSNGTNHGEMPFNYEPIDIFLRVSNLLSGVCSSHAIQQCNFKSIPWFANSFGSTQMSKKSFNKYGKTIWIDNVDAGFAIFGVSKDWLQLNFYFRLAMDENGTTHRYKDVYTTVSLWGHPDAAAEFETIRFSKMTERLETVGYVPGLSIRAAPYDFRKAPNENEAFCANFKQLIQDTYIINNNKKVVLLAHSMGNMYTLYCLNRLPQDWKDKYIKSFICIAAPWGGSPYAIKFIARGEAEGLEFSRDHLVDVARSWPSLLYLLPHENFFDKDFPFIRTPTKNYSIQDYEQLFIDLHMPKAIPAYRKIKNLTSHMVPPRVEVHCMYGYGFSTEGWYTYTEDDFPHGSSFGKGMQDGDAVVTVNSANACTRWSEYQLQPVISCAYRSPHPDLILNDTLINHVKEILFEKH